MFNCYHRKSRSCRVLNDGKPSDIRNIGWRHFDRSAQIKCLARCFVNIVNRDVIHQMRRRRFVPGAVLGDEIDHDRRGHRRDHVLVQARKGRQVDLDALLRWLTDMAFNRVSTVIEPGDFAVRGGIVDLFPPGEALPVRLDFFGDVLEGARRFDPESQRTVEKIGRIELAPASEVVLDAASIQRFRTRYREIFGAARPDDPLYAAVSEGRKYQGLEHWVALFQDRMETVFDYLP